jgi:hypothetical protein
LLLAEQLDVHLAAVCPTRSPAACAAATENIGLCGQQIHRAGNQQRLRLRDKRLVRW